MDAAGLVLGSVTIAWKTGEALVTYCKAWKEAQNELEDHLLVIESVWWHTNEKIQLVGLIPLEEKPNRLLKSFIHALNNRLYEIIDVLGDAFDKKHNGTFSSSSSFFGLSSKNARRSVYALRKARIEEAIQKLETWCRRFEPFYHEIMAREGPAADRALAGIRRQARTTRPTPRGGGGGAASGSGSGSGSSSRRRATQLQQLLMKDPLQTARDLRDALSPGDPSRQVRVTLPYMATATLGGNGNGGQHRKIKYAPTASLMRMPGRSDWFIVDSAVFSPPYNMNQLRNDATILARKLAKSDPFAFGLLNCKGFMSTTDGNHHHGGGSGERGGGGRLLPSASLDFIFRVPEGLMENPMSLRLALVQGSGSGSGAAAPPPPSLSRRMGIARELARSVSAVHTFRFVHKNIRPESVLLFEQQEEEEEESDSSDVVALPASSSSSSHSNSAAAASSSRGPRINSSNSSRDDNNNNKTRSLTFLVGFSDFRSANGVTQLVGDREWDRNLYRHPTRQGDVPKEKYRMDHDIYSLGVCLLEIGLWKSFVTYDETQDQRGVPIPGPGMARFQSWHDRYHHQSSWSASIFLVDFFVHLARTELPFLAGDVYAQVVEACLTCMDNEQQRASGGGGLQQDDDPDGVAMGLEFIQGVLSRLDELVV